MSCFAFFSGIKIEGVYRWVSKNVNMSNNEIFINQVSSFIYNILIGVFSKGMDQFLGFDRI